MPPERSLQQTRTVKGGQVAAAGTIGAGAIGAIQETGGQAHEALAGVVPYLLVGWLAAAAAVAAALFGARQAGRTAERVERMRRTAEVQP